VSNLAANPLRFPLVLFGKAVPANEATLHSVGARARVLFGEYSATRRWLRRRQTSFARPQMKTLLWDLSAFYIPLPRSPLRGTTGARRQLALLLRLRRPSGLRFPSKSCSASTPKSFVWTLRKCIASALGSRPHSQGFAQCDPSKLGKFKTETITCTRTKSP
jgi:hypothetical protein